MKKVMEFLEDVIRITGGTVLSVGIVAMSGIFILALAILLAVLEFISPECYKVLCNMMEHFDKDKADEKKEEK